MDESKTPRIAAVYGAATPPGRMALALERAIDRVVNSGASFNRIDLYATPLAMAGSTSAAEDEATRVALRAVSTADALLVTSPVYRGSYPGILKNLFDLLPVDALHGKPVALIVVGATDHHFLGVDRHMRDLLAWFGALPLPTSVYLTSRDFGGGGLSDRAELQIGELTDALIRFAMVVPPALGPAPLAAQPT